MGRITGSASIETLVRVGIEKENGLSPESKMVVLHDFTPCVDDELEVKRGQVVHVLYQASLFSVTNSTLYQWSLDLFILYQVVGSILSRSLDWYYQWYMFNCLLGNSHVT